MAEDRIAASDFWDVELQLQTRRSGTAQTYPMVLLLAGCIAIRKVDMNSGDTFQNNCPHCQTRSVAFAIEYVRSWWHYMHGDEFDPVRREATLAVCGFCDKSVLAEFGEEGASSGCTLPLLSRRRTFLQQHLRQIQRHTEPVPDIHNRPRRFT